MKLEKSLRVSNQLGLHARPAAQVAKLLRAFTSSVYFTHHQKRVDAKQVMNLLLLEAHQDSEIYVEVEGEDASSLLEQLTELFESHFGEALL